MATMHARYIPVLSFLVNLPRGWFGSMLATDWPDAQGSLDLHDADYAAVPVGGDHVWVFSTHKPAFPEGSWADSCGATLSVTFYQTATDRVILSERWADPVSILRRGVG